MRRAAAAVRLAGLATALLVLDGCGDRPSGADGGRFLVFGIDGADWDRAVPLMRQGKMPVLSRLARTGVRRTLRSLQPERLSPTIWTTAATGVLPERHGVVNFVVRTPGVGPQPVTSNQRKVAALWNILSARGRTVGVIGWLVTWPAEPVNGYLVSSYMPYLLRWGADPMGRPIKGTLVEGIPDQVWPRELQRRLERLKAAPGSVDRAELAVRFTGRQVPETPAADAAGSLEGMRWSWAADETYRRIFHDLAANPPGGRRPEVEMLYFGSVDVISHRFWKYMEPSTHTLGTVDPRDVRLYGQSVEGAYRSLDRILGGVLGTATGPLRVLVLSDHGFRENRDARRVGSGWHRLEGLLVAAGPGFRRGELLPEGSVVDVTPTVLYALGLPVARDMDGRPALDLFTEDFRERTEPAWIPSYEPEVARAGSPAPVASPVDEEILSRLRALGYLD